MGGTQVESLERWVRQKEHQRRGPEVVEYRREGVEAPEEIWGSLECRV